MLVSGIRKLYKDVEMEALSKPRRTGDPLVLLDCLTSGPHNINLIHPTFPFRVP